MRRYALAMVAFLTACGGGSSSTPPTSSPTGAPVSPTPSTSPSAPPASPAVSPSSLAFASGTQQSLTVSENGYTGGFHESDTCQPFSGAIASVTAGATSAGSATYAVSPIGAGTCTITVTDTAGHATAVNVTVSIAAITVQ